MALKDFQSIQVAPGAEDGTVRMWMSFGWELKNKQRVKTQDVQKFTGQDSDGTEHYQTTRGVDFFELTFERDPERKNYAELVSLEKQYYAEPSYTFIPNQASRVGCLWLILSIVGWFIVFSLILAAIGQEGISMTIALIVPIAIIIWRLKSYSKRNEAHEEAYGIVCNERAEHERKRTEILEKARSLV